MAQVISPLGYIQIPQAISGGPAAFAQGTSITTTVASGSTSGVINLKQLGLTNEAHASFTFTNPNIKTTSVILLTLEYPTAKAGEPSARISSVSAGSCVISIFNTTTAEATDETDLTAYLHYVIVN